MRGHYPWKIGATSFVIPASVEDNVRFLAGKVDDIQLLFFESSWQARLPHHIDINLLADLAQEHGHSYTVHLPLDLQLGSADRSLRLKAVAEIERITSLCNDLAPEAYDVHCNLEPDLEAAAWSDYCLESFVLLQKRLGKMWRLLCIENINYDFGLIAETVQRSASKVCVDFGHLHHQGFEDNQFFSRFDIGHVHLHGVDSGHDHRALTADDRPFLRRLAQEMKAHDYGGVVSLELYKADWLAESLRIVDQAWSEFTWIEVEK